MRKNLKRFMPLILSYPKYQILGLVFGLLAAFFNSSSSYTLRILIDDILIPKKIEDIWTIQFVFIGLILLYGLFTILKTYFLYKSSTNTMVDIRNNIMDKSLKLPLEYYNENPRGDIINLVTNDVNALSGALFGNFAELFTSLITIVVVLGWMVYLDIKLTLITIPVFPILLLVFKKLNKEFGKASKDLRNNNRAMLNILNETYDGIKTVKVLELHNSRKEDSDKSFRSLARSSIRYELIFNLMSLSSWVLIMVPYQAILYGVGGSWYIKNGLPTIGLLMAFGNFTNMLIGPTLSLLNVAGNFTRAGISLDEIEEFLENDIEKFGDKDIKIREDISIRLENIDFTYGAKRERVLKDISFTLDKGNIYGLTGKSGSGKSTILNLLMGFYKLDKGEIYLNQQKIEEIKLSEWRKQISYLIQEPFIFNNTLRYNLLLANKDIDEERILEVLGQVDLLDWFYSLEDGLDSRLGESGGKMSIGQKQRLGIAQTLLRDTPIIILDEPTSALDYMSEDSVLNILEEIKEEKIILIVTHRKESLDRVDKTILLEDGRVNKIGKWKDIREYY